MKKAMAAALISAATVCGSLAEETPKAPTLQEWVQQMKGVIRDEQIAIHDTKPLQISACSQTMSAERRAACNAAYNMVITLRDGVISRLQLRLASVSLDYASQHVILYDIAPPEDLDRARKFVNDAWTKVWQMFPAPQSKK